MEIAFRGTKGNNCLSPIFLQVIKKLTDTLMKEKQGLVFEKTGFVFQEKSNHFHSLTITVRKSFDALTFFRNALNKNCFRGWILLIETMQTGRKKVILKITESVYQDGSYNLDFLTICRYQDSIPMNHTSSKSVS